MSTDYPPTGLMQITAALNADVWREIAAEARKLECEPGLILAAAWECYKNTAES